MLIVIILINILVLGIIYILSQHNSKQLQEQLQFARQEQNQILSNAINIMEAKVNASHELSSRNTSGSNKEILNMIANLQASLSTEVRQNSLNNKEISENILLLKGLYTQIDKLDSEISSLSRVLDDKQLRGAFGEKRLSQILELNYGNGTDLFAEQVLLSNGKRADVIINYPESFKRIVIDAKFPLENYQRLIEVENEDSDKFERLFISDVKKHIKAISSKYIINGETAPSAMMFVPSEAVFHQMLKMDAHIVDYAYQNKVWIVSPTTLMAVLTSMDVALKDVKLNENLNNVRQELEDIAIEFSRFEKRLYDYNQRIKQMDEQRTLLDITAQKLIKRFENIKNSKEV